MQTHSISVFREPANSGSTPSMPVPAYIVASGSDWSFSTTGPEQAAFFLVGSDYVLINLTPVLGVYHDTGGTAQPSVVPGTTPRLNFVSIAGTIVLSQ